MKIVVADAAAVMKLLELLRDHLTELVYDGKYIAIKCGDYSFVLPIVESLSLPSPNPPDD